jgi:uncharacterized protein YciI
MKQYVIIARDGTDDQALNRRMDTRPVHLAGAARLKANNNFVIGGAMLNDAGQMEGSVMIVQFETADQFTNWYNNEPDITGGVWKTIEVKPFKVAEIDAET